MENTSSLLIYVFIGIHVLFSMVGFENKSFFDNYKFNINALRNKEYYRLITSGLLHADLSHLLFNMYTLYIFAPIVTHYFGDISFLVMYMFSLIASGIFSYYTHQKELYYSAIGASGAVSGILYAAILIYPEMSLYLFFIPIPIPAYLFAVGYLLYSIYGMKKNIGNIGHDAHFAGAVSGLLIAAFFSPQLVLNRPFLVGFLLFPIIGYAIYEKMLKK